MSNLPPPSNVNLTFSSFNQKFKPYNNVKIQNSLPPKRKDILWIEIMGIEENSSYQKGKPLGGNFDFGKKEDSFKDGRMKKRTKEI